MQVNGNGTLDSVELTAALTKLGCKTQLSELDSNGDGIIDFDEFSVLATVLVKARAVTQPFHQVRIYMRLTDVLEHPSNQAYPLLLF